MASCCSCVIFDPPGPKDNQGDFCFPALLRSSEVACAPHAARRTLYRFFTGSFRIKKTLASTGWWPPQPMKSLVSLSFMEPVSWLWICSITRLCLILCDPIDCSSPGSSVHGILQVRILEWVAISFSRGPSQPWISCCCSVAQLRPTLCDPMDFSTPGFPVLHYLPEFAQIHVPWVTDAIQPSHPLSPYSPVLNLSQHQGLFHRSGFDLCANFQEGLNIMML